MPIGGVYMYFKCVLEDKYCNDCGQCNVCDLDNTKICDNCCKCIDSGSDYNSINIDEIIEENDNTIFDNNLINWKYKKQYYVNYEKE